MRLGEEVLATDPELGVTESRPVVALISGDGEKHLVEITVDTDGTEGDATGSVVATGGHPIWVDDQGRFVPAEDVHPGDFVRDDDGALLEVLAARSWTGVQRVHNLTIDGIHTYYVFAGDASVLVHNCAAKAKKSRGKLVKENDAGRFGDLSPGKKGDGLEANHMPQDALHFTKRQEGGAIVMKAEDHALTRTYKNKGKATKAAETGLPFRTVLARDIRDLRRIGEKQYGDTGHYNKGIRGLLKYYRDIGML